jgi:hypothetical protein
MGWAATNGNQGALPEYTSGLHVAFYASMGLMALAAVFFGHPSHPYRRSATPCVGRPQNPMVSATSRAMQPDLLGVFGSGQPITLHPLRPVLGRQVHHGDGEF